ncbi:MAG: GxxExxY protein [Euryarchaeota archaeon]|nr:GxxExxY protein [Euryarchaeota archaeon]
MDINKLSSKIIGAAIEVHKTLGPGLLESTYEECLCHELSLRGLGFERQRPLPVMYKNKKLDCGFLKISDRINKICRINFLLIFCLSR